MIDITSTNWYIVGYLRTVPNERTFVFPVVQNEDAAIGRAYYVLNDKKLEFVQPNLHEALIRIVPLEIPDADDLKDALPLYGYEYDSGKVWIGDACNIAKMLINFVCECQTLTERARQEISDFVVRVIAREEFVAKKPVLLQGQATISESQRQPQSEEFPKRPLIKIMGVGRAGCNAVEQLIIKRTNGAEFICASSNAQLLKESKADRILLLGNSRLDASVKENFDYLFDNDFQIRELIKGSDLLFIIADIGGKTGSAATAAIARIAKDTKTLTIGVVTMPFDFEGIHQAVVANATLKILESIIDSLIVIRNESLLDFLSEDVTRREALAYANEIVSSTVRNMTEILNVPGHMNVDFEDVRTVMSEPGKAAMGTAAASGPDRARMAAEEAVNSPLLKGIDLLDAKGVLVLVTASQDSLKLSESKLAMNIIRAYASPKAHFVYGAAYDKNLGDEMRVTLVATGLSHSDALRQMPALSVTQTGTDKTSTIGGLEHADTHAQPNYEGMAVPSVWRTNRTMAPAKVDALSSGGMDDFEIPDFLKR